MGVLKSLHINLFLAHLKTLENKIKLCFLGFVTSVRLQRPDLVVLKQKSFSLASVGTPTATWPSGSPRKAFVKQHIVFSSEENASWILREERPALHPHGKRGSDGCACPYTYATAATAGIVLRRSWPVQAQGSSLV